MTTDGGCHQNARPFKKHFSKNLLPPSLLKTAQETYQQRSRRLGNAQHHRMLRIIKNTIGKNRVFPGTVVVGDFAEKRDFSDKDHLEDIWGAVTAGKAAVYWSDGSREYDANKAAVLGAGVAWPVQDDLGKWGYESSMYALGHESGCSRDAELFGIAATIRLAASKVQQDSKIEHVRVFSDCAEVLEGIQTGSIMILGPALGPTWALQEVYDHADFLVGQRVELELVWCKAHAGSEGNTRADRAAGEAAKIQGVEQGKRKFWKREKAPELIAMMGQDAVEEWYWRRNKESLLSRKEEGNYEEEEMSTPPPPPPPTSGQDSDASSQGSADMEISSSDSE